MFVFYILYIPSWCTWLLATGLIIPTYAVIFSSNLWNFNVSYMPVQLRKQQGHSNMGAAFYVASIVCRFPSACLGYLHSPLARPPTRAAE